MTEIPRNDLAYGHLGQPTYDPDHQEWFFLRNPNLQTALHYTHPGLSQDDPDRYATATEEKPSNGRRDRVRKQNQVKLIKKYPTLQPASGFIGPYETVSEAVLASDSFFPALGDLLAIGKLRIPHQEVSHHLDSARDITVAAVAGGKCGDVLRLIESRTERQGWNDSRAIWLETSSLDHPETACWPGLGSKIQQICFDQHPGADGTFLAVRYPQETVLLRPAFRRQRGLTDLGQGKSSHLPYRLEINPKSSISVKEFEGCSHADVAFNHFANSRSAKRELAIVDQRGHWSTWSVQESRSGRCKLKRLSAIARVPEVEVQDAKETSDVDGQSLYRCDDGWARVLWVGAGQHLLVSTRGVLVVYDVSDEPSPLACPDFGLSRNNSWVLDIRQSPVRPEEFFVLTSSDIFLGSIQGLDQFSSSGSSTASVAIRLSLRHFRDTMDISLSIRLLTLEEGKFQSCCLPRFSC